jgi:hypothetical protein
VKGIVFENKEFKVVSYESDSKPDNMIIYDNLTGYPRHHVSNVIVIKWVIWSSINNPRVFYKGEKLDKREGVSYVSSAELMNYYNNLSEEEIQLKYEQALKQVKSDLEKEVDELREKKEELIRTTKNLLKEVGDFKNNLV